MLLCCDALLLFLLYPFSTFSFLLVVYYLQLCEINMISRLNEICGTCIQM